MSGPELIVESSKTSTVFTVRALGSNWYYEVMLGFRKGERSLENLWATCKCFQEVWVVPVGESTEPKLQVQQLGPVLEYSEGSITFKRADPKALDFTLANPGWDLLAADVADTYRTYVDRKPKIGL